MFCYIRAAYLKQSQFPAGSGCDCQGNIGMGRAAGRIRCYGTTALGIDRYCVDCCRNFFKDRFDLHIRAADGKLMICTDGYIALDDLPLYKAVALVGSHFQGDFRAGCARLGGRGGRAAAGGGHGDGEAGQIGRM